MIPLVLHSHFSLLRGTASPRELVRAARDRGFFELALTDRDNLYGLWEFLEACREEGVRPLVGAEVSEPGGVASAVCLVHNEVGYANLCLLLTARHCRPDFSLEQGVVAHHQGLVVLAAEEALLGAWRQAGVELAVPLPVRPDGANHRRLRLAKKLGLPAVAVPGSFFLSPADFAVHRLLRAIANNTSLARLPAGDCAPADAFFASLADYRQRFAIWPETLEASRRIAARCAFSGPRFGTVMPPWPGDMPAAELRRAAEQGAGLRYGLPLPAVVAARLEHELAVIEQMGFSAYFLVVRDIVSASSRTCGRGSGAASLVAYVLGITNVCPVRHNLYFERFLNPGRTDPPDIDVDFAWDERDGILAGVLKKFGDRAAMVANHVGFQLRGAIRETARVFGLPEWEIGRITKKLPWLWRLDESTPLEDLASLPRLRGVDLPPPWPQIIGLAVRLLGRPRLLSVHPGGVVISPEPIARYVPVQRAAKGVPIIQWEKDGTETAGLVKIDLLGNRSLAVIRDAVAAVRSRGIELAEHRWHPEDDPETKKTVAAGTTMGCFYIESPATRLLQQKAGRGDFEHLVIHSSIIRPAANFCIREYLRRLHGGAWQPVHPLLGPVLEETYGIMVYQEDVSRAAVAVAGFSHAEADGLRKVLSKKDRARRLADYRQKFFEGARGKGLGAGQIDELWAMMMSFDGYSFCKPHSASYARVSFQAAYLKSHFPAEFMAAVISNQGGYYSTFAYLSEARRLGLVIRRPDVEKSETAWTGRGRELRVGLMAVAGLSAETRERILGERQREKFRDAADFLARVRPAGPEARSLVQAGALDGLAPGPDRRALLWELACHRQAGDTATGLFAGRRGSVAMPRLPAENRLERLRREFAALGFLVGCHPMQLFDQERRAAGTVPGRDLPGRLGRPVLFAGWLITGKVVRTRHGDPMEFLTFEDETALVETVFFPKVYHRFCHLLESGRPYLLAGRVVEDFGALTLEVSHLRPLRPGGDPAPRPRKNFTAEPPVCLYPERIAGKEL